MNNLELLIPTLTLLLILTIYVKIIINEFNNPLFWIFTTPWILLTIGVYQTAGADLAGFVVFAL
jgi:hypothetical protein